MSVIGLNDMTSVYQVQEKLKNVLAQFLSGRLKISDDTCFEKLLTHLSKQNDDSFRPICLDWFNSWIDNGESDPTVTSFAVRLVAQFSSTESGCRTLHERNVFGRLGPLLEAGAKDPTVKLAHIQLLLAFIQHDYGRNIVVELGWWQHGLALCYNAKSMYVTRDSQKFVTESLKRLGRLMPDVSGRIIRHVLQPVTNENAAGLSSNSHEKDLAASLTLLRNILETCLIDDCIAVPQMLLTKFALESEISTVFARCADSPSLTDKSAKLLMLIYLAMFRTEYEARIDGEEISEADTGELERRVLSLVSLLIQRNDFSNILNVSVYCHLMWKKIFRSLENTPPANHLLNQLMTLQLIPVITSLETRTAENECLDSYCNKLFAMTSSDTQRVCYSFRERMLGALDDIQLNEMAREAILSILQLENVLHRERAVLVFQALMYKLKDFVPDCRSNPAAAALASGNADRHPRLLAAVLESLTTLIRCYSVTWRESVETVCLVNFTQNLLQDPNMSAKLCVLALKLIEVAVIKFMPPNLALLVDTLEGSSIDQLGPLLLRKLNDTSWEVRDSALEVLQVLASIAHIKFPAFQAHLLENGLCSVALRLACDDGEGYVRASALKCLAQMVRVRTFWEQSLSMQDLTQKVLHIMQTEQEGIVRKEAASLMKEIYQHNHIPKSALPAAYKTMSQAVTGDLYWEVEVNALAFWACVIERHMTDEGMIDGVFPGVTFAKQTRKIVTLTPDVIVGRLGRVVAELGRLGCLQLLLSALQDCDIEVARKSAEILSSLARTLSTYGVIPFQASGALPPASPCHMDCAATAGGVEGLAEPAVPPAPATPATSSAVLGQGSDVMFHEFLSYRGDKRKLNNESAAGTSEEEEIGYSRFVDSDDGIRADTAKDTPSNNLNSKSVQSQKTNKIFKIDNLGELNGANSASAVGEDRVKFKFNKYELGCVPISFAEVKENDVEMIGVDGFAENVSNNLVGNNGSVYGNNDSVEPRYKDDLGFNVNGKHSNVPTTEQVRKPKVNNAVANPVRRTNQSEKVIDDIVLATDMNLLATVYSTKMTISDKEMESIVPSITADEFLTKLTDLNVEEILAERSRWLSACASLGSLLDDILAVNMDNECSALDCY